MNNNDLYINIKDIAEVKGLTSTRAIRLKLNDPESGYISREVKVSGGTSYEILFSSLEPETQKLLLESEKKSTALIPRNYQPAQFVSDSAKLTANFRTNIVVALQKLRKKYSTKKEADSVFLDLYNSGLYLPKAYKFIGSISIGTLHRWVQAFEKHESAECLQPKYKWTRQGEYNSILNDEMKHILLTFLLHPSQYNYGKAIKLTKEILKKRGYENLPCDLSFKRYAEHFRKNNYAEWVLRREGMKAYHDKVEPYIERDISKIEVGDVIVADGHVLNFQVINPFNGKPTRATLVGFLDWKSTALIGYEIMMTESTQCIASALRNAILNLGMIPKVVYQDNGKAFKSRFFQSCDFEEDGFNGVYANLNIHSVFAKPYNARAKVIERFFREFQEELEKGMPSYIGTCIEDKPAWLKRGEHLHQEWHKRLTNNHIPTVQEAIKYINSWLELHKHCIGYRGGNVVERPEKLADEIRTGKVMDFERFKKIFDLYIINVFNKMESDGKNLNGQCPDELFNQEFKEKIVTTKDALKLFCTRTSRNFTIGRNGIKDKELGITYWADWMLSHTGEKVYLRRDPQNYKEAWAFKADNEEFLGVVTAVRAVAALHAETVSKEEFQDAMAIKKRALKIAKSYIETSEQITPEELYENYKAFCKKPIKDANPRVTKIANTNMDKAIQKSKEMAAFGKADLSIFMDDSEPEEELLYLFETDKRVAQELKGVANGY